MATPKPAPIFVPQTLRDPCAPAEIGALETEGDKDALILREEGAVKTCSKRGDTLVEIIDGFNKALADASKSKWWPF